MRKEGGSEDFYQQKLQNLLKNRRLKVKKFKKNDGGAKGIRTPDLLHAMQAHYQLCYSPNNSTVPR